MRKILVLFALLVSACWVKGQTFNGTGGTITGTSAVPNCFPINVTGIGNINTTTNGLSSVCIKITHPYTDELEVVLKAPDGTTVPLTIQNGGSGNDYNNTCFSNSATNSIKFGSAPFSGTYIPEGYLGTVNNGQNADGSWEICVQDRRNGGNAGVLNSWSLTFSNTPSPAAPAFPACTQTVSATSSCASATSICDFNGVCGTTAGSSVQDWPNSGLGDCFGLQRNSFIKFIASATTATFTVWVPTSSSGPTGGIQMLFFSGTCDAGPVTPYACYPHIFPYPNVTTPLPTIITATGLTVGDTCYLMFDGFNSDNCTFSIAANSGVRVLSVNPAAPAICAGKSVSLTASGSDGPYNWSPAGGLNTTTGPTVTASPATTTTYTVTGSTTSGCSLTKDVTVTVNAAPVITPPVKPDTLRVCQNGAVRPFTVAAVAGSGAITGYQWYIMSFPYTPPGVPLPFATGSSYTPSASSAGQLQFYAIVTNSNGCTDTSINSVLIVSAPLATPTASATVQPTCAAPTGTIVVTAPTGTNIVYSSDGTNFQSSGTFSSLAPGSYSITAKDTVTGCVSPVRTVTINALPPGPAAPTASVTTPPTCVDPAATITITAPIGSYEYSIGGAYQAGVSFAGLTNSTTYQVTVKDLTTGCISAATAVAVGAIPGAPATPVVTPVIQPTCTVPTGSLTISSPSGANYEFCNGGTYQSGNVFPNLVPDTTYSVTVRDISTGCVSAPVNVIINALPVLTAPTVVSPVNYCQNATTSPLTAAGTNLLWYSSATGGTGSSTAPTPSSAAAVNTNYYVSQETGVCESPRSVITVVVTAQPAAPVVTAAVSYCQGQTATALTATGTSLLWYNTATGGTGSATAPTPSTTTATNTDYYVSDIINGCESNRSLITVTVNPTPSAPAVSSSIAYCENQTASALTATGTNLLWYTSANGGVGSATAPTPVTTAPTAASYWVSQTAGGCEGPRAQIVVTVNAIPAVPGATTAVNYCQNETASPLSAIGSNLLWYTVPFGGSSSSTAPTPVTTNTGNANYYVTQTINNCESQRLNIIVTVTAIPAAPGVTATARYCQNSTAATLSATGTNLLWYNTANGGTGTATAPTPATGSAGIFSFYVSQTVNGCESPRSLITVTVDATPAAPVVTTPVTYCQNTAAVALTATGTNLSWYTVATGGTASATAPVPVTSSPGPTNYFVSQTAAGCEGPRAGITVTVNPTPAQPAVTATIDYCQNAVAVPLTATGANLLWYSSAIGGTGTATPPTPSTVTGGNTTTYFVSQTLLGCEGPRSTITVTVKSLPAPPTVVSPVTYCQNVVAAPLTATGNSLLWYTSATGGTSATTAPTPQTATPNNVFYYVTQTVNGCESQRRAITVTVEVTGTAVAGFRYTPDTVCINGINPVPNYNLGFTTGGTFTAVPAGLRLNAATGNIDLALSTTGTYTITYTYNTTGCTIGNSASFDITLLPAVSTVTLFSYSSPVCKTAANLSPMLAAGFTTGGIFSSGNGLALNGATGEIDVASSDPGQYQVAYRLAALGCRQGTTTFSFVTINDTSSPVTSFTYSSTDVCITAGINPTTVKSSGFTIGGTFTATPAGLNVHPLTGDINIGLSVPGVYNIVYDIPAFLCRLPGKDSVTFILRSFGNPVTGFSYFDPVCKGDDSATAIKDIAFTPGGVFSSSPGGLVISASTGVVDLQQSIANTYNIRYDVNAGVCNSAGFGTTVLNLLSQPEPPAVNAAGICGEGNITLTANALGTVSWYTEPALLNQVNVGSSYSTFISNTTNFYVTNTIGTCESKAALLTASVSPVPVKPNLGGDTAICPNDRLILNAGMYNGYLWQDGSTAGTYTVTSPGVYSVVVSTGVGCTDSASITVSELDNCDDILFPNAFSPNGDINNPSFGALGNLFMATNYTLRIFNRYGETVFVTTDPSKKWDGMYKGKPVNVGTYVYVATYLYKNRITKTQKGTVMLVR